MCVLPARSDKQDLYVQNDIAYISSYPGLEGLGLGFRV